MQLLGEQLYTAEQIAALVGGKIIQGSKNAVTIQFLSDEQIERIKNHVKNKVPDGRKMHDYVSGLTVHNASEIYSLAKNNQIDSTIVKNVYHSANVSGEKYGLLFDVLKPQVVTAVGKSRKGIILSILSRTKSSGKIFRKRKNNRRITIYSISSFRTRIINR